MTVELVDGRVLHLRGGRGRRRSAAVSGAIIPITIGDVVAALPAPDGRTIRKTVAMRDRALGSAFRVVFPS